MTRPDRPQGRGRRLAAPPVADAARELGIALAQPESVNDEDARVRIAADAPDVVCVCAFGALIKEPLLSDHLILNVHPSLLPRWRGRRADRAGDHGRRRAHRRPIMQLTAGLDSGPVCLTGGADHARRHLRDAGGAAGGDRGGLLVQALDQLPADCGRRSGRGAGHLRRQDHRADRLLAPDRPAPESSAWSGR